MELHTGCPGEMGNTGEDKDTEEEVVLWGRKDQKLQDLWLKRGKSSPQAPTEKTLSRASGEPAAGMN